MKKTTLKLDTIGWVRNTIQAEVGNISIQILGDSNMPHSTYSIVLYPKFDMGVARKDILHHLSLEEGGHADRSIESLLGIIYNLL